MATMIEDMTNEKLLLSAQLNAANKQLMEQTTSDQKELTELRSQYETVGDGI